jgi:hypothetical protein
MKAVCHYCKDKKLAEQSNNLCIGCFNAIVKFYAGQGNAQDHCLETLLMGLKPEPLEKLYNRARYLSHLDYCQKIIQFYLEGKEHGKIRRRDTGKHFNRRGDLKADRLNKITTRGIAKQRRLSVSEDKSQQPPLS